jgi:hypothetical protein
MLSNTFSILISLRTPGGFESFGKYNLGNNRKRATAIFRQLKGSYDVDLKTMLTMELEETINGLPVNLQVLACTLEELAHNTKIIAKETFRFLDLKEKES